MKIHGYAENLKDWVEAQMALLDIEMVRFEEIFLPYIQTETGQTVYERLEEKQFLLEMDINEKVKEKENEDY